MSEMWKEVSDEEIKLLQLERKKKRKRQTINWSVFQYWAWITALYSPKQLYAPKIQKENGEENEILKYVGRWSIENTVHKYILLFTGENHEDYLRKMIRKDKQLWRRLWRKYITLCSKQVTLSNLYP
ncbi:MAG: hypothetical protein QXG39_10075 [Candidatus Aenigmatarchaeota archaeon]